MQLDCQYLVVPGAAGSSLAVSPDGKHLFFSRSMSWITSHDSDIYWVSSEVIHRLRPKRHEHAVSFPVE